MRPSAAIVPAKIRIPTSVAVERERLTAKMSGVWDHRVTTVTAPAGSGKTTLLTQLATSAAAAGTPVAWYQAEPSEGAVSGFLRHLDCSCRAALGGVGPSMQTIEQAAQQLDRWIQQPTLLVIDDLHALEDTPADDALEQLIRYAPPALHLVTASRRMTRWNLPRLRVSGRSP
jgi:ATP/maltotriose-dependent transcriptional regulator MalT